MKKVVYLLAVTAVFSIAILSGSRQAVEAKKHTIPDPMLPAEAAMVCTPPPSGLISWYRAENNTSDARSGNDGVLKNGASYAAGETGQGFTFDGMDDYAAVPDSVSLRPVNVTVEGWFKFNSSAGAQMLVAKTVGTGTSESFVLFYQSGALFGTAGNTGGTGPFVSLPFTPVTGTWYHISYTFDDAANTQALYINGTGTSGATGISIGYDTHPVIIGMEYESEVPSYFFNGTADEVAIYDRALSQTELQDIYNAATSGKCVTPTAFSCSTVPANLNSWFTASDSTSDIQSGNTNGSLIGNATYTSDAKVGRGFTFDGNGDYLSVPDAPEQRPVDQLTVEGWYEFDTLPGNAPHLIAKPLRNANDDSYAMWFSEGNLRIGYRQSGGGFLFYDTGFVPQTGVYYHIAFVLDTTDAGPTANTIKLFVNGIQVFSGAAGLPIYYNGIDDALPPHPMVIGADLEGNEPQYFLDGQADEVSLFGRALSAAEIQSIYGAQTAGKCGSACMTAPAGMVAWYPGENSATDIRGGNDGTMQNGAAFAPGRVGQAFSFDGSNDYISIPKTPALNFGTGDFSVEFWVKFNNTASLGGMVSGDNFGAAGDYNGWLFNNDFSSGGMGWMTRKASVGATHARFAAGNFSNGTWYHLAGVRSGRTLSFYVNGTLVSSGTEGSAIDVSNPYEIRIGSLSLGSPQNFPGMIDELALYSRALSPSEVASVAGAGKCKPSAVTSPSGQTAWWPGDGNAFDITGNGNNGTLQSGATFAVSKAGQGFSFDALTSPSITVPDSPSLDMVSAGTIESWIYLDNVNGGTIISKGRSDTNQASYTLGLFLGNLRADLYKGDGSPTGYVPVVTPAGPMVGRWSHLALTWDGANFSMFVNGILMGSSAYAFTRQDTNIPVTFGKAYLEAASFSGRLDEISFYDRPLSVTEIKSIFTAGIAGKLKTSGTPAGLLQKAAAPEIVNTTVGDVTVTFQGVTTAGATQQIPVDMTVLPPLPNGATWLGLAYDVSTTAVYTGGVGLCFNVPSLTATPATNLRVYHLESATWVNRTAAGATHSALCTTGVTSLSPFGIVNIIPSAASVSISGRALTAGGRGIINATVQLTDPQGGTRTVQTGSMGYYNFEGVAAGQNYTLSVSAKRFRFTEPTRIVFAGDEITGADFIALE